MARSAMKARGPLTLVLLALAVNSLAQTAAVEDTLYSLSYVPTNHAAVFLASADAAYISGITLRVDGGPQAVCA